MISARDAQVRYHDTARLRVKNDRLGRMCAGSDQFNIAGAEATRKPHGSKTLSNSCVAGSDEASKE